MADVGCPPVRRKKLKRVRIQVGDHLDLNLGLYLSPKAMGILCTLCAGGGGFWTYLLQR